MAPVFPLFIPQGSLIYFRAISWGLTNLVPEVFPVNFFLVKESKPRSGKNESWSAEEGEKSPSSSRFAARPLPPFSLGKNKIQEKPLEPG